MASATSPTVPTLGRRIHVRKMGQDGEETDESYWLWLDAHDRTLKGLRNKCMETFAPPQNYAIRFIHEDGLLCNNSLLALPNKCQLWVQFVPNAPLTPVSARKNRNKRPVLSEDEENVDPCLSADIDAGSPIRKRQRLYPRPDVSNVDLSISTPPSPFPSESFRPFQSESSLMATPPCSPPKHTGLDEPPNRNRRHRSNASASFSGDLITRHENPLICSETPEDDGLPLIAWEIENRDESYYGYGILSFDKPRPDWVPSIAFDLLPRYPIGVTAGIDFNMLVCDVPYSVTVGEIRAALAANLALDPVRLPQGHFHLTRKGQKLEDWMTCVPAYIGDGDAVFIEFGDVANEQQSEYEDHWAEESTLVDEDLDGIKLVKLPCDSDDE